jgi:hypothetical protein
MKLSQMLSGATLVLLLSAAAQAQRSTGTISGRIVTEDGQPLPRATITIVSAGGDLSKMMSGRLALMTDANGEFEADRLDPAPYIIQVTAPGYQPAQPVNPVAPEYHFVGETVTVTMRKGGVITGKVTSATGEPVVGVPVSAASLAGPVQAPAGMSFNLSSGQLSQQQTDDRGVYRLYGLAPGKYVVSAGTGGFALSPTPFLGRTPAFYPAAATRGTATPILVHSGEEISGIDIQYRAERGHSISGKVAGLPQGDPMNAVKGMTMVLLKRVNSDEVISMTVVMPMAGMDSYALNGVPNGEYEVLATQLGLGAETQSAAAPRRVAVNGADLSGIDLTLSPLAALAGKVVLEKPPADTASAAAPKCNTTRASQLDEIVLSARKDQAADKATLDLAALGVNPPGVPNAQGVFVLRGLSAGRYRLAARLPDESWYLKSLWLPAGAAPADPARAGLVLKAGERRDGLTVTLAVGAASLQGAVKAAPAAKAPARWRVHLLPAELPAKDDLLRFAEVVTDGTGSFKVEHLAPGKYLLVARDLPADEAPEGPSRPLAWDATERAKLRREAETVNVVVELAACQRKADVVLPWK